MFDERGERLICDGDNLLIYDYYNRYFKEGGVCGTLATHPQDGHSGTFLIWMITLSIKELNSLEEKHSAVTYLHQNVSQQ